MSELPVDDDLEIEVEDDGSVVETEDDAGLEAKAEKAEKPEPKPIPAEEGVADFKARFEAEKKRAADEAAARKAAEDRAAELEKRATGSQAQLHNSQYQQVLAVRENMAKQHSITKREYAEAMRSGDYDKVAELQGQIAQEAAAMVQLESRKTEWENYLKNPPQKEQPAKPAAQTDPAEAFAAAVAQQGSPRSADWIRKNPEYARDHVLRSEMIAAANRAEREGHAPESDGYFEFINKRLGLDKTDDKPKEAAAPRKPPAVAAPPARQAASTTASKTVVKLSKAEQNIADELGLSYATYAANKQRAIKEGRMSAAR